MRETPAELRSSPQQPPATPIQLPECGSFLDAPRANPASGDLARKCAACRDWYPVAAGPPRSSWLRALRIADVLDRAACRTASNHPSRQLEQQPALAPRPPP